MARTGRPRSFDDSEVVRGATEVFWRRGYVATSMRDLKERLGVFPGSLYSAFGTKHALFLVALRLYADDSREAARSLIGEEVLARLHGFLCEALAAAQAAPGRGCLLGNTAVELVPDDEETAEVVRRGLLALEDAIERALQFGQENGEIRDDIDCGSQARLLLALVQGLHVLARAEPVPGRLEDAIDAALAPLSSTRA